MFNRRVLAILLLVSVPNMFICKSINRSLGYDPYCSLDVKITDIQLRTAVISVQWDGLIPDRGYNKLLVEGRIIYDVDEKSGTKTFTVTLPDTRQTDADLIQFVGQGQEDVIMCWATIKFVEGHEPEIVIHPKLP